MALSISLMFWDHSHQYSSRLRERLSIGVIPFQYLVDFPSSLFRNFVMTISNNGRLQTENTKLQSQVLLLQAQLQKLYAIENENTQLRALLQSMPRASERVLVAQLLSVNYEPYVQQFTLNQGSKAGAFVGQPVVDSKGVLGQIISVTPYTSTLLLITDTRSAVPVLDNHTGIRGILAGTGNSKLQLINIPTTTNVYPGDVLVTSGLGGQFPEGYPVGVVQRVTHSPGDQFSQISVLPTAQVHSSRLVLLIWLPKNHPSQVTTNTSTKVVPKASGVQK